MTKQKISILSLSLVTGVGTIMTVIIPLMAIQFPRQSLTSLESFVTITSLSALVTILMNDFLVRRWGIKKVVLVGLISTMIFGFLPIFFLDFNLMMISRVLLGLGIGLYSPHAISLISLFYTGEERAYLLGIQMGIAALGNAIFLTMAGFLAKFEWSFAFLVYLFLGGIAWLIYRHVPSIAIGNKKSVGKVPSIDYRTKKYLILCFVTFLIIWGVQLKIPTFLVQNQIYSSGRSGLLLSSMNIAGMIAGFLFGFFFEKLKNNLLPLGFIGAGIAICGMAISQSWGWIVVFGVFFNFIYSFTGPFIVLKINQGADERQFPKVNAMITTTTILSSYFAPFVWNQSASLFNFSKDMSRTLIMIAVCTLVIGIFLIVYQVVCSKRQKNKQ